MSATGEFSKETVDLLAKRAALHCSNPDCGGLTSAPTVASAGAINIGEAAHIYGRTHTSKRYNPALTQTERSDITNGIWLCRNCHKEIDNDEPRFPAELLFEWRKAHEQMILEKLGLKSDLLRNKLKLDRLRPFERISYLAQQIAYDRPPHWEYKLTMEVLRKGLEPIHARWEDLQGGLYIRKSKLISFDDVAQWWNAKFTDAIRNADALRKNVVEEMGKAWGAPGEPRDDLEILRVSKLIIGVAENFLEWEEDLRFSSIPEEFSEVQAVVQGTCGAQLNEILRIPRELSKIFDSETPDGLHKIQIVLTLPDNYERDFSVAMTKSMSQYLEKRQRY